MQTTQEILGTLFTYSLFQFALTGVNSPWVILNDFGGAFSMGAVGGTIWHGIKGARNSPRVRVYIWHIVVCKSDQHKGGTCYWCNIIYKGEGASYGREFRGVGWDVFNI
jgi:hypothetical protein